MTALVLPLVVIVGFQSAWAAYACRVDGKVRDHCCCKAEKKERKPADDSPRIAAQSCCDVTINETRKAPLVRESDRATFAYMPIVAPVAMHAIATPRIERVATIAMMARPPPRVPLFLDKQAILR
jgi:hypothetical protein